jgi:hypothetical protein
VRPYKRPNKTVRDRVRPYIQPYVKSTPRVSPTVSKSYINRMESFETVPKSYIQHPINTRMSQDHGTSQTGAHTVSYDRHTTNTVHVRKIHSRHGIVRVNTVSHCLVRSYTASTEARTLQKNTATCCLPTKSTCCIILECIQRRRFGRTE